MLDSCEIAVWAKRIKDATSRVLKTGGQTTNV